MFCRTCGTQLNASASKCLACGESIRQQPPLPDTPVQIPNYLVHAILVTICCCLPFGIPAIVYAAQVNDKIQSGDIHGAMECSRKAKMWVTWSFVLGLLVSVLSFLITLAGRL